MSKVMQRTGVEIFRELICERDPDRAVETMDSADLAALICELQEERWDCNSAATWTLAVATETAVSRFLLGVELKRGGVVD